MALKFLTALDVQAAIDLNQNQLTNVVVHSGTSEPSSPVEGQLFYRSDTDELKYYTNAWQTIGTGSGDVSSVNGLTGTVVLDADDISDAATTNKFATSGQLSKVDFLTITQAVDLDTLESNVATNNAKVSNVTTNLSTTATATSLTVNSSDGTNASIPAATTSAWGAMTDEDKSKLDGIEASADVTDSANVTTALGSISVTAHSDVSSVGSGAIITSAERSKLSGIEASADVTDSANVTTALGSISVAAHSDVTSAGSGAIITSTERTKLSGISTGADVTADALPLITENVTVGDAGDVTVTFAGAVTIQGNLDVNGTTTTVDSTNTTIADALIELGSGNTGASTNDLGLILERGTTGDNGFIGFDESADKFIVGTTTATGSATGDLTITTGTLVANIEGNVTGDVTGNADTATAWATGRSITLSGDVSGTATGVDGTGNVSITTTIADDSHNHTIANVDGLQTALDAKVETLADLSITATATEINLLDGITTLSGSNTGDEASASTTVAGVVELATNTETTTGTDSVRAVTPAGAKAAIDARTYATTLATGSSAYTITHNLGTRDVIVQLYENATPYNTVYADVERDNTTQVGINFASNLATAVRVLVTKVV